MSNCPSCSRKIKIDESHYGTLYTCPHCQSVFFVGWDGQPENSNSPLPDASTSESFTPQPSDFITSGPTVFDSVDPLPPLAGEAQENPFITEPTLESETPPKENFSDVLEFANAIEDKGLITYTLTIEGIDLSHLHQQLTDALTDPKFNWQVEDILAQIQNGTLILKSLNAAKASVLVQRLKFLPLEIHWRQNVLTS